ncbi:hypothetical protein V6N12_046006 [Hibiscus sabdariffa]|uniref:Uncharacterized protein n=1 Tax=Hibiscus sabdariffa TaxID=183260 RepID=A0ABR2G4V4_9ROSI
MYSNFGVNMDFQEMQKFLNSPDIMGGQSGYMDFFTTPPPMRSVTEEVSYTEEEDEEAIVLGHNTQKLGAAE